MTNIDELRTLEQAATPAPWHASEEGFSRPRTPTVYATDEELRFIARCRDLPAHVEHEATDDEANMRLIATMRNAMPDLLRELQQLRTQHARARELLRRVSRAGHCAYTNGDQRDETLRALKDHASDATCFLEEPQHA